MCCSANMPTQRHTGLQVLLIPHPGHGTCHLRHSNLFNKLASIVTTNNIKVWLSQMTPKVLHKQLIRIFFLHMIATSCIPDSKWEKIKWFSYHRKSFVNCHKKILILTFYNKYLAFELCLRIKGKNAVSTSIYIIVTLKIFCEIYCFLHYLLRKWLLKVIRLWENNYMQFKFISSTSFF